MAHLPAAIATPTCQEMFSHSSVELGRSELAKQYSIGKGQIGDRCLDLAAQRRFLDQGDSRYREIVRSTKHGICASVCILNVALSALQLSGGPLSGSHKKWLEMVLSSYQKSAKLGGDGLENGLSTTAWDKPCEIMAMLIWALSEESMQRGRAQISLTDPSSRGSHAPFQLR